MSTPLDAYMTREEVKDADFALIIERDRSMVNKLRRGIVRPTLDVAAAIERATAGAVPMQAWTNIDRAAA
jgi:plasmid maintenance system antidote protein VapI